MRIVVSQHDPGVPNWIDIGGRPRGLLVYRWVWARDNPVPSSKVVDLAGVRAELPADHPRIDAAGRRAALARRREQAWKRFL